MFVGLVGCEIRPLGCEGLFAETLDENLICLFAFG